MPVWCHPAKVRGRCPRLSFWRPFHRCSQSRRRRCVRRRVWSERHSLTRPRQKRGEAFSTSLVSEEKSHKSCHAHGANQNDKISHAAEQKFEGREEPTLFVDVADRKKDLPKESDSQQGAN